LARNGEKTIVQRKRSLLTKPRSVVGPAGLGTGSIRGHWAGELVALSLVALGGAAIAAWRANQRAEEALNARTWARLLPPQEPSEDMAPQPELQGSGAD
jgi:hypothetical protein